MRRFRFSLRWMLVAVATVALLLGMESMRRRRKSFSELATAYASSRVAWEAEAESDAAAARDFQHFGFRQGAETIAQLGELHRAQARYCDRLATKYRSAARYPWLPVVPDPPEPK